MPLMTTRKLIKMGDGGLVMTVPKGWVIYHNLQAGDQVVVIVGDDLRIKPLARHRKDLCDAK